LNMAGISSFKMQTSKTNLFKVSLSVGTQMSGVGFRNAVHLT